MVIITYVHCLYCINIPAVLAQWLCCGAAKPKDSGSIPAAVAAFVIETKRKYTAEWRDFGAGKNPPVVKINLEPYTMAGFITQVRFQRVQPPQSQ